ncbi:MAG TPA: hypothetical protein VFK38_03540 [Candidatus Limnocylindrales bacterium]|nr:hypothetical protein [Candidatus Limnocylindrales bacterium]
MSGEPARRPRAERVVAFTPGQLAALAGLAGLLLAAAMRQRRRFRRHGA